MALKQLYTLLTFLLIGICRPVFAQQNINGRIIDAWENGISDASIEVINGTDSSLIATSVSDTNGQFSIVAPTSTTLLLKIKAAGYNELTQPCINDSNSKPSFKLTKVSSQLSGITVTAQKPLLERKIDRMIFNVSASISSIGTNALEAMRKAPGVLIKESDNSISLAGKSGVNVLIDDRPLQLSGEDLFAYLQAIPSENIERIEVITTPPARYDAAGNSGLINIVLKKNKKMGVNGEVRAGYEQSGYGTVLAGGNINYRKGPLNVYANAGYANGAKNIYESLNTKYTDQTYLLTDHYKRDTKTFEYTLGADLQLSKKSLLGVQLIGTTFNRIYRENSDILIINNQSGTLDSMINSAAIGTVANQNETVNINYVYNIDTAGKNLTLNTNRLWFNSDRKRDYDTQSYLGYYTNPTGPFSRNKNNGVQDITITTAQADLELPYKRASISAGARFSYTDNKSRNNFLYFDNGEFLDDASISNEFQYTEQVIAGYVSAQKTVGKWDFQGGLRGELTDTKGYSIKLSQTNTNRYFKLFPTAFIQYKFNENNIINLNYSKRIERPGYRALDPYRSYSSPYSYIEGNPFLQPGLVHYLELAYTYKSRYNLTAFYQASPNTFGQIFFADTVHKTTYVRNENYGDYHYYGLNATASFSPIPSWELQASAGGSIGKVIADYTSQPTDIKAVPTFLLTLNNSISLNKAKTLVAQADIFYISSYMNDLLKISPQFNMNAGFRASLFDKKLIVSLNANDIFRTSKAKGVNVVSGQAIDNYFDVRNVRLMINYRFGNNKIKEKRERRTGIEDETRRT